jgi:hypothetical protein
VKRFAFLVAAPSGAMAFGAAVASFYSFNGQWDLMPSQWQQAFLLGGITFAVCFLAALAAGPAFLKPRAPWVRFLQGAAFGLVTMLAVTVAYAAMNSGGDFVTSLLAYADITLWFGGFAVPFVAGLSAVGFGLYQRAAGTPSAAVPTQRGA